MKILTIIPARYASSRFPAKALALINGEPMVYRVYQKALEADIGQVVVATDHIDIQTAIEQRGGEVILTSSEHPSGTDRCGEALAILLAKGQHFDFVINLQGDEPFIAIEQIRRLAAGLQKGQICTLAKVIEQSTTLQGSNIVKVVWSKITEKALYFSRHPIPFIRSRQEQKTTVHYKHIGLYGFDANILLELTQLAPSHLEKAESLEQLRWLEYGYPIKVIETNLETQGIDTIEDLKKALEKS